MFGIWDDPKCDESGKQVLAYLTTGADGVSGEGERTPEGDGGIKKINIDGGGEFGLYKKSAR